MVRTLLVRHGSAEKVPMTVGRDIASHPDRQARPDSKIRAHATCSRTDDLRSRHHMQTAQVVKNAGARDAAEVGSDSTTQNVDAIFA